MSDLAEAYQKRFDVVLKPLAKAIAIQLREYFEDQPRIDNLTVRPKSVDSFLAKARAVENGQPKYSEPLRQIQDQIGARIVTYYLSDVEKVARVVDKYFRPVESRTIVPESEWEFGYFGQHYVLFVPSDVIDQSMDEALVPQFFELQVKTLFQHAWSEANHDLGYKLVSAPLNSDGKRRLAFTSAQAWGADRIFDELFQESTN